MSGSPPEGYVFEMRKASRAKYHKQIKCIHNHREEIRAKNIATSFLNKDFNTYYHSVNLLKGKGKNSCPVIDGHSTNKDIADCFAESYKTVFNDVGYDKAAMSELLKDITDDISRSCVCSTTCGSHVISRDDIVNSVKQMRPGKNDGFDGLSSDYILNAPMSLFEILSVLFTCMLHHSYSPDSFCLSTMVPIPKGSNKDLSMSKNYRGIALGSIFSKIFDNCIISAECLALNSNDLQFAYKSGCSTTQCVSVLCETIDYYVHNESDVYMCSIDASKAFDRVNILLLFRKLRKRNFCPLFLRYLVNSYCNQMMMVRWNGSLSDKFDVTNGVKQGGVLSPLLFSVYMNDLLCQLRDQNIGCHMNSHFVGAVIYADDITLLGPTRNSVMALLDICSNYAHDHDIIFNPSKTTCIHFPCHQSSFPGKELSFMGTAIKFVSEITFLGISIKNNDVTDHNISKTSRKFYHKANQVMNDFKYLYRNIKSHLLSSYCLDAYGSQLWPFYDKSVKLFYVAWRRTIRKLWALPNTTHCKYLHTINNSLPIDLMLEKRCLKFIWSCINSNNTIVKSVSSSAIMYSYSSLGENYRFLSDKYGIWPINWTKSFSIVLRKFYDYVDKHVYSANEATLIRDLCIKLDSGDFSFFNIDELNEMVVLLCTA